MDVGLGSLAAPIGISGALIGVGYLYRDEIFCDEELWQELKSFEFSRLVNLMQTQVLKETFEDSLRYMNNKKNQLWENEYVQTMMIWSSAIYTGAEKVVDVTSDLTQKAVEELPQLKQKINTAAEYATDAYKQVAESETVSNIRSKVQQFANWGLNNLRYQ